MKKISIYLGLMLLCLCSFGFGQGEETYDKAPLGKDQVLYQSIGIERRVNSSPIELDLILPKDFSGKLTSYYSHEYREYCGHNFSKIACTPPKIGKENLQIEYSIPVQGSGKTKIFLPNSNKSNAFLVLEESTGEEATLFSLNTEARVISNSTQVTSRSESIKVVNNFNFLSLAKKTEKILLITKEISPEEKNNIQKFVLGWGRVVTTPELFNTYFRTRFKDNNEAKRRQNAHETGETRSYGKWSIKTYENDLSSCEECFWYYGSSDIPISTMDYLLTEDIKKRMIPYTAIIIFIVVFFLAIIPGNFLIKKQLEKKKKDTRLYFMYAIPLTTAIFLGVLIIGNLVVKWRSSIESHLEVNYIKDNLVLQEVHILEYAPYQREPEHKVHIKDLGSSLHQREYQQLKKGDIKNIDNKELHIQGNYSAWELMLANYERFLSKAERQKQYNRELPAEEIRDENIYNRDGVNIKKIEFHKSVSAYAQQHKFNEEVDHNYRIDIYYQ